MYIANPIDDTVFKFLLEDNALAKLLIGAIIQEEILSLDFRPQERTGQMEVRSSGVLTVYRVDFAARVRNAAGEERLVLIELQKAKYPTDIMPVWRELPSLTIYFLAHALDYSEAPVIRVQWQCTDLATGTPLAKKEPFIESLTHDSYIIQIPKLHRRHRTEMEAMLQLFDQSRRLRGDRHRLEIDETEIPKRYWPLLRRLQQAVAEPEMAEGMDLEDEMLEELQDLGAHGGPGAG